MTASTMPPTRAWPSIAGDAVGFLNADDRYADGRVLSRIAAALSEADIAFGNLDFVADQESQKVVRRWRGTPYQKGAFRRGWMPAHPTFYVRRAVADSAGWFDTRYRVAADYDFMLRALELGNFRATFIDSVLIHMAQGGVSTHGVAAYVRHNREALLSRRRWLGAGLVDYALLAKPLRKLTQFSFQGPSRVASQEEPPVRPQQPT